MQISKSFLVACLAAYCVALLPLRAADADTERKLREALEQKLKELETQPPSPTPQHGGGRPAAEEGSRAGSRAHTRGCACRPASAGTRGRRAAAGGLGGHRQSARGFAPEDGRIGSASRPAAHARGPGGTPARSEADGAGTSSGETPAGCDGTCSRPAPAPAAVAAKPKPAKKPAKAKSQETASKPQVRTSKAEAQASPRSQRASSAAKTLTPIRGAALIHPGG